MEARALVREARAQYFPTVSLGPSYTRARSSGISANSSSANTGKQSQIYALPLDVSWTPDLFGRIRNQVRNAQYNAQVSAADLENERLIEQADLAEYFFEIRGQDALIKLYTQTVAEYQKSLDLHASTIRHRHRRSNLRSGSAQHPAVSPGFVDQSGYFAGAV